MTREEQIINLLEFYYRWSGYMTFSFYISNDHLSELPKEYILEFARERNLKVEFDTKVTKFSGNRSVQVDVLNKLQQENQQLKAMLGIGKTCAFCPYYKSKKENIILRRKLKEIKKIIDDNTLYYDDGENSGYDCCVDGFKIKEILDNV